MPYTAYTFCFITYTQAKCVSLADVIYLSKVDLYQLAATRLTINQQDRDLTHLVAQADADALPLTWATAHMLSPPRCHLAPVVGDADLQRMHMLLMIQQANDIIETGTTELSARAWTGVYKETKAAYYDRLADAAVRREKWTNFAAGTTMPADLTSVWNAGQPKKYISQDTTDIMNALAVVDGGLTTLSPRESLDGAFYQCCALFAFEASNGGQGGSFETSLLSMIDLQNWYCNFQTYSTLIESFVGQHGETHPTPQ